MASDVGYETLTFNSLDVADNATAPAGGFYDLNFWGVKQSLAESAKTLSGLLLNGLVSNGYGTIVATAAYNPNEKPIPFKGKAFGGGWYYESTFSYTGTQEGDLACMWAVSVETIFSIQDNQQWVEMDGPEFNVPGSTTSYGRSLHNWYRQGGVQKDANPEAAIKPVTIPHGQSLVGSHTYGNLWVPAQGKKQGYMKWFFDGQQIGETVYWDKYSGTTISNGTFPPTGGQIGAVTDIQHFVPIFQNANPKTPMTITSVHIWQASEAGNIIH